MAKQIRVYKEGRRTELPDGMIFCFGSNFAGVHGKGAAKDANAFFGAIWHKGEGFAGRSYAIPTKDHNIHTLPTSKIRPGIERFVEFTQMHRNLDFFITGIGTGLARLRPSVIAPMFKGIQDNCIILDYWAQYIPHIEPIPIDI